QKPQCTPFLFRTPIWLRQAPEVAEETSFGGANQRCGHVLTYTVLSARMLAAGAVNATHHVAARLPRHDEIFATSARTNLSPIFQGARQERMVAPSRPPRVTPQVKTDESHQARQALPHLQGEVV